MRITPYFELNGNRYEIKRTRWLLAEYDKLSEETGISNSDKENAIKAQSLIGSIKKYAEKTKELEEKYFETFDDEDERKYLKAKALYDNALAELTRLEVENGSTTRLQKAGMNLLEKIAIKGIAEQYFDFDEEKATCIWEKFVDTLPNHSVAMEWLSAMSDCLFNDEEEVEENSFLSMKRKMDEERAKNRKKLGRK